MKFFFLLLSLCAASVVVADDRLPLQPDSLLNWLRMIELDGNRLIHATETDESFFAVSQDQEGDLFIAHYAKEPLPEDAKREVHVTDPNTGRSAAGYSHDKVNLKTATATYRSSSRVGTLQLENVISIAVDTGLLVPLIQDPPKTIRVRYQFAVGDRTITRIDTYVVLPRKTEPSDEPKSRSRF